MTKLMKRLALCLATMAAFALALILCGTAMAAEPEAKAASRGGKCGENLTWTLDGGTLTISGTGDMEDYIIPGVGPVVGAAAPAPWNRYKDEIKALVVESGVTGVGEEAFSYTSVKTAELPDTLKRIGMSAFSWCSSLEGIEIPDSVETVGSYAFSTCVNLRKAKLPNGLERVGSGMFEDCYELWNVEIPASVTAIGEDAFSGCSSLRNVIYGGSRADWNGVALGTGNDYLKKARIVCQVKGPVHAVEVIGSCADNSGKGSYEAGEEVTLLAGSRKYWTFTGWTAKGVNLPQEDLKKPKLTFIMPDADVTAEAHWEAERYSVAVSGSRAENSGKGSYAVGEEVTLRAGTWAGWTFDGWRLTGVKGLSAEDLKKPEVTFKMPDADVTAEAGWKENAPELKRELTFLLGGSAQGPYTSGGETFYICDAVINGEYKSVNVAPDARIGDWTPENDAESLILDRVEYRKEGYKTMLVSGGFDGTNGADRGYGRGVCRSGERGIRLGIWQGGPGVTYEAAPGLRVYYIESEREGDRWTAVFKKENLGSITADRNLAAYYTVENGRITFLALVRGEDWKAPEGAPPVLGTEKNGNPASGKISFTAWSNYSGSAVPALWAAGYHGDRAADAAVSGGTGADFSLRGNRGKLFLLAKDTMIPLEKAVEVR